MMILILRLGDGIDYRTAGDRIQKITQVRACGHIRAICCFQDITIALY